MIPARDRSLERETFLENEHTPRFSMIGEPGKKPQLKAISFSGCGGMFPYLLGVAKAIGEDFDLSACQFYGASGGTAPAALLAAEHDIEAFFEGCALPGLVECGTRWHGTFGNGLEIATRHMHEYLPDDFYLKVNGRASFVVTTLFPRIGVAYHSQFEDTPDMIKCCRASSLLPGLLTLYPGSWYRGALSFDGGFIQNQPACPNSLHAVRIYPNKFRATSPWWVWPCTDAAWNRDLFWTGYADGKANAKHLELEGKGALTDVGWCQYGLPVVLFSNLVRYVIRCVITFLVLFSRIRLAKKRGA